MTKVATRVAARRRHKRLLQAAKGFWGQRKNIVKRAKETLLRAMAFAYHGRKLRKRDMRSLFIMRIKASAEANGLKYNTMMHGLKLAHVSLNRKMLSQIAFYDAPLFGQLATMAKNQLAVS